MTARVTSASARAAASAAAESSAAEAGPAPCPGRVPAPAATARTRPEHDPREEKRQTVGVIFRGAHEVAEGAEGVRAESAGTLGAGDGLGVRDVEEEGDAVAEDGSDGVGEERGSVAGGMEGGDRVAEGGNGGDAEGLGVGVAFARARREDGDEDGEEVHGGVGGGAARVRATNHRPDAPDRRLERATTRRARRGREGAGDDGDGSLALEAVGGALSRRMTRVTGKST